MVSKRFIEKSRALVQLMSEEDELTLMAISSVKTDLASDQANVTGMALSVVANSASTYMCREVARDLLYGRPRTRASQGKAILASLKSSASVQTC